MRAKPKSLPSGMLQQAAERLKVMAHPVRLNIVQVLPQGEFCVREIAAIVGSSPNQTCGHLRLLQAHKVLSSERRGRTVYYRVASPCLLDLIECIRKAAGP
jgi:DNA-binding transcriptional ArsR family regulator